MEVHHDDVPFVFFWIKGFHLSGVIETRGVPFDLFADLFICGEDDLSNILDGSGYRRLMRLDEGIDFLGIGGGWGLSHISIQGTVRSQAIIFSVSVSLFPQAALEGSPCTDSF